MDQSEIKPLNDILQEAVRAHGLNVARLQQLTGIPEHSLQALLDGQNQKLPAAPYVRGYFLKIAQLLELDGPALWERFQRESEMKTSGQTDRLPTNRFAIKPINKTVILVGIVIIGLMIYGFIGVNRLLGSPELAISSPSADPFLSTSPTVVISGKIDPRDIIKINNEGVVVSPDGAFSKEFPLQLGFNAFEFSVKRLLGKETKVVKHIIYQPTQP